MTQPRRRYRHSATRPLATPIPPKKKKKQKGGGKARCVEAVKQCTNRVLGDELIIESNGLWEALQAVQLQQTQTTEPHQNHDLKTRKQTECEKTTRRLGLRTDRPTLRSKNMKRSETTTRACTHHLGTELLGAKIFLIVGIGTIAEDLQSFFILLGSEQCVSMLETKLVPVGCRSKRTGRKRGLREKEGVTIRP